MMPKRSGKLRRWILGLALAGGAGYLVAVYLLPWCFALPEELRGRAPAGLLFVDREDRPVRRLLDGDLRADEPATYPSFPRSWSLRRWRRRTRAIFAQRDRLPRGREGGA